MIAGERTRPRVPGAIYQQMEIEYGSFQRQVRLAEDVDPAEASASFENGVLTIVLPVADKAPPAGRFTIEVFTTERARRAHRSAYRRAGAVMSDFGFETPEPEEQTPELPAALPVLPLKETVVFPQSMSPLAIGQERSVRLIDDVVAGDRLLTLITSRNESIEQPGWDDIYEVGTIALVHKMIKVPDGTLRILVQGLERVSLDHRIDTDPYLLGEFSALPDIVVETPELEALTRNVQGLFSRIIGLAPYLPEELQLAAANVDDPSALAHLVASTLRTIKTQERQELLETLNVEERLRKVSAILSRELEVFELGSKIQSQVQSEMEKGQREYFLRQQLKAIQQELGEADPEQAEVNELRERLGELTLPEDVAKAAERGARGGSRSCRRRPRSTA